MKLHENRTNQTIRFLKWTRKHNGLWQLICEPDNERMNLKMTQEIIKKLAKEQLYEIIFVLMEVHKDKEFMKSTSQIIFKDLLIAEWEKGSKDAMLDKLIGYLE